MNPKEGKPCDDKKNPAAGTLVVQALVVLAPLGLVAYLVSALRSDAPVAIAEVIAAAASLLAAAVAGFWKLTRHG